MPCPGPHRTPLIRTWELPCPMEMQSSPVAMDACWMVTSVLWSMWIPSVLGLSAGAEICMPLPLKFLQPTSAMWKNLLFNDVMPFTTVLVVDVNLID